MFDVPMTPPVGRGWDETEPLALGAGYYRNLRPIDLPSIGASTRSLPAAGCRGIWIAEHRHVPLFPIRKVAVVAPYDFRMAVRKEVGA